MLLPGHMLVYLNSVWTQKMVASDKRSEKHESERQIKPEEKKKTVACSNFSMYHNRQPQLCVRAAI